MFRYLTSTGLTGVLLGSSIVVAGPPLPPGPTSAQPIFWLDASDIDGDGAPDGASAGPVAAWIDKIGGLVLEQSDGAQQPEVSSFGAKGAPSLFFDGGDFLEETDASETLLQRVDTGSVVAVYTTETVDTGFQYVFTVTNASLLQRLSIGSHDPASGGSFIEATFGAEGENDFFFDRTFASNDGNLHVGEIVSDGAAWSFYHNGAGPNDLDDISGCPCGIWYGDIPAIDSVSLGQLPDNAPDTFAGFTGHLSELLVFEQPLTPEERGELTEHLQAKYGGLFGDSQLAGDCDGDGDITISDLICILTPLYTEPNAPWPCGVGGTPGNVGVLDVNGDGGVDLSDVVYLANFKFGGCYAGPGNCPPPINGTGCLRVEGCEGDSPGCSTP